MKERREAERKNVVVLIDADNTNVYRIESVLEEISKEGRIAVKRAYGDFTRGALKPWEEKWKKCGIKLEHVLSNVSKKNATDIALTIDAMNLYYTGKYDIFAIVSGDSDFTRLALELRENDVRVIVVGKTDSPISLINACDAFLHLEDFPTDEEREAEEEGTEAALCEACIPEESKTEDAPTEEEGKIPPEVHGCLTEAWRKYKDKREDGFILLGAAGKLLKKRLPAFSGKEYHFKNLTSLLEAFPEKYEVNRAENIYRCKEEK